VGGEEKEIALEDAGEIAALRGSWVSVAGRPDQPLAAARYDLVIPPSQPGVPLLGEGQILARTWQDRRVEPLESHAPVLKGRGAQVVPPVGHQVPEVDPAIGHRLAVEFALEQARPQAQVTGPPGGVEV